MGLLSLLSVAGASMAMMGVKLQPCLVFRRADPAKQAFPQRQREVKEAEEAWVDTWMEVGRQAQPPPPPKQGSSRPRKVQPQLQQAAELQAPREPEDLEAKKTRKDLFGDDTKREMILD